MSAPIMKIDDAIALVKGLDNGAGNMDLLIALQNYRGIMYSAYEVVNTQCMSVIEYMEEHNMGDSEEDTLTQDEQESWIELAHILGEDYPVPDWYHEMWIAEKE